MFWLLYFMVKVFIWIFKLCSLITIMLVMSLVALIALPFSRNVARETLKAAGECLEHLV